MKTNWIAVYGAALSTLVFLWNLKNSRAKIKVAITPGVGRISKNLEAGFYIHIKNLSPHTVHIASAWILYPYCHATFIERLKFIFKYRRFDHYFNWINDTPILKGIKMGLPKSIDARNSHNIFIPYKRVKKKLRDENIEQIAACVQDALGQNKYSSIFKIDRHLL